MTRLLLDTHVLLWLAEGLPELPVAAREVIDDAMWRSGLTVSAISFWEIAMLAASERIALSVPVREWRLRLLAEPAIEELPMTGDVAVESALLPGVIHRDPADRMLIATARLRDLELTTRDTRILRYGAQGHVRTLAV